MRSLEEIHRDIAAVKQSIKYARQDQDEVEEEALLTELDNLLDELHEVV